MEPEIIGIPELARLMGRSESSIRTAVGRLPDWLPKPMKQGRRVCWRLESARQFIREFEAGEHRKAKVGRPRQSPQLVGQRFG